MSGIMIIFVGIVFLLGCLVGIAFIQKERTKIINECEKWKTLYKKELNKWKNKYNNNDYEAY